MRVAGNPIQNPKDHSSNSCLAVNALEGNRQFKKVRRANRLIRRVQYLQPSCTIKISSVNLHAVYSVCPCRHSSGASTASGEASSTPSNSRTLVCYGTMHLLRRLSIVNEDDFTSMMYFFGSLLGWKQYLLKRLPPIKKNHTCLQPLMDNRSQEHSNQLCLKRLWKLRVGSIQLIFPSVVTCAGDAAAPQGQNYLNPPWGIWILE